MSTPSILDQARDFLLLPPDAPAEAILEAALARKAEWETKSQDPKAPARLKEGAARKLKEVAPFLPLLEAEAQLAEVVRSSEDPKLGQNQLLHLWDNVTKKIASLPPGEAKEMLAARLQDFRDAAKRKEAPPPLPPDPAVAVLEARLEELRSAIISDSPNKIKLSRLLADANKAVSKLRDADARQRAEPEIEALERKVDALLAQPTVPPFDPAKIANGFLATASLALDRGDLGAANQSLLQAGGLLPQLTGDSRAPIEALHASLSARHRQLAEIEADLPAKKLLAEKMVALVNALNASDLPRAATMLAEARVAVAKLRDPVARTKITAEIADVAARLTKGEQEAIKERQRAKEKEIEREKEQEKARQKERELEQERQKEKERQLAAQKVEKARADLEAQKAKAEQQEAAKRQQLATLFAQVRDLLERADTAAARSALDKSRALATTLLDAGAREAALVEIDSYAQRLTAPSKIPPLLAETEAKTVVIKTPVPKPPAPSNKPQAGQILKLVPDETAAITGFISLPLRLVARSRFVIGRSSTDGESKADFSVPLTEKRVSRAHVTLHVERDEILIADGDDGKKSSNGSTIDEEALTPKPAPSSFSRERKISLGSIFTLSAQHLPAEAPAGPPQAAAADADNSGKTMVIKLITGCMKFSVKSDAQVPMRSAWIFTDASIGAAATNALPLPKSGLAENHARLHYWQDSFWIENLRSGSGVRVGDRTLAKGEAAPLHSGDKLFLGQLAYHVTVEA